MLLENDKIRLEMKEIYRNRQDIDLSYLNLPLSFVYNVAQGKASLISSNLISQFITKINLSFKALC